MRSQREADMRRFDHQLSQANLPFVRSSLWNWAISLVCLACLVAPVSVARAQDAAEGADAAAAAAAQESVAEVATDPIKTSDIGALKMRSIGPALMSGRIADIAIDPLQPNTWYVAAGSGNVWKTVNAGTTWTPIFENYPSYSIGCITIDPQNHNTIWVGTGENVAGRHVGFGDGVYVSHDAGKSFKNMGLEKSEHISKIIVHPEDSQTVFVAVQGPLWSSGGERGLYKTTDGGQNWALVLEKGEWTGVTDLAMDPNNADVLYAATHQRHRTVWALIDGGPESGIFKSTDGGESWSELTSGLPSEDKGKMSVAVSPLQSNVLYATIELADKKGGVWRSEDFGASWKKMSDYVAGGTGPHYYQEIYCDPHRFDVLYHANVMLGRSEDGGATWGTVANDNKHVDNHAVAFHPLDKNFLLVGCDGGLYRSYDYGQTYQFTANLPLTQFYKVAVSYEKPFYHVAGGTQDNNSQYGPVQTRTNSGIRNADWRVTIGGDGHDCAIDPEDPNIIYGESQEGYIRRFDRLTGETVDIRPQPEADEEDLRHNWDSPIEISPHLHTRIYFGSKKLHRSDDRGDSWTTISPDLSRNRDRMQLPHMGRVWSVNAIYDLYAMSQYGNITSIDESPLVEGLIYVGTDDGLIQVTEDGGATWRKIDKIFGVPEYFFVNDIKADRHDADTVYAAVDNHKTGDYKPYLLRSTDRGRTWESITGDLPDRHLCWRVIQDHERADLLFLGTEFGAFFTVDAGQHWTKLPGTPTIPFRDLEIQRDENDLVGATFGRGFYVLDDYTPLRKITAETFAADKFELFEARPAKLFIQDSVLGGGKGSQGDAYFTAENPDYGAVFTYYVPKDLKTAKQIRAKKEQADKEAGQDSTPPTWDALRQEELEEAPEVILTIRDADGEIVSRVNGATSKGLHRTAWDLRYSGFTRGAPLATPGIYTVEASQTTAGETTELAGPVAFEVQSIVAPALEPQSAQETLEFQLAVSGLQNKIVGAARKLSETLEQLSDVKSAIKASRSLEPGVYTQAVELERSLKALNITLSGDDLLDSFSKTRKRSILERIQGALYGTLGQTYGPTATHRQQFEIAEQQFGEIQDDLKSALEDQYPALLKILDEANVPWTSGRALPE